MTYRYHTTAKYEANYLLLSLQDDADCRKSLSQLYQWNKIHQKVLLAQTLVQQTDIIALDEPTSHLDIGSQATIFKLLKMLNEKYGKTIITTVHDLNLAGEFCSDIALLDNKKVLNFGSAEKVLNYKDIERVYSVNVVVHTNPVSKKPVVIPVYN